MATFEHLQRIVSNHYDIGELVSAQLNDRGHINVSFGIETHRDWRKSRYVLRRYHSGTRENKIRFEHALMHELLARKLHLSPSLIATNEGASYVKVDEHSREGRQDYFIAILGHLPGEDKYSWDDPWCTHEELKNAAEVLARYHSTIFGWEGISSWDEPRIVDRIPLMARQWREYAKTAGSTVFEVCFQKECDYLLGILRDPRYITETNVYDELPHLAIHGDYHPGNLKFQDGRIVGLFDFDWAKMDARCFDVGVAITYFCTAWDESADGNLLRDRVEMFLKSYQESAKTRQTPGPLSGLELQCLPQMILAGNLYVLDWTIGEYYSSYPDVEEYLRYFLHGVRSLRWLEDNWDSLSNSLYH
jgi:homoserine kinase type II